MFFLGGEFSQMDLYPEQVYKMVCFIPDKMKKHLIF